jgi:hypothetical protein
LPSSVSTLVDSYETRAVFGWSILKFPGPNTVSLMAKQYSVMVNALESRAIGALFDPMTCPSLMVLSGGKTDVQLGFSLYSIVAVVGMVVVV